MRTVWTGMLQAWAAVFLAQVTRGCVTGLGLGTWLAGWGQVLRMLLVAGTDHHYYT